MRLAGIAAVCAVAAAGSASLAQAAEQREFGAVGIVQGQSVRLNVSSSQGSTDSFVRFVDGAGTQIRANRLFVPEGTIRSLTVNFAEIPSGPGSFGRRTVRAEILTADQVNPPRVMASLEIVDMATRRTMAVGQPIEADDPGQVGNPGDIHAFPAVGLTSRDVLSIGFTAIDPTEALWDVFVRFTDAQGRQLMRRNVVVGGATVFTTLAVPTDSVCPPTSTARCSVRVEIIHASTPDPEARFVSSLEVFDGTTGRTRVVLAGTE
jgi:hypothetical protein